MIRELVSLSCGKERSTPRDCTKWKIFYRKKGGPTEKKGLFLYQDVMLCGRGEGSRLLLLSMGMERTNLTYYLIGVEQKILDWLINVMFL